MDVESSAKKRSQLRETPGGVRAVSAFEQLSVSGTLITRISSRFINLPAERIEKGVRQALGEIGEFSGVDRCFLYLKSRDEGKASTFDWHARGVKSWIQNWQSLPVESFPWWADKLSRFEPVLISSIHALQERDRVKKEFLKAHHIQSFLAVPVEKGHAVNGFIGLDTARKEIRWSPDLISLLKLVGEIFLNALERKRAEQLIKKRNMQLELVHRIQNEIPLDESIEKILLAASESIGKAFGYYKISVNLFDSDTGEIVYLLGWNKTGLPLPRGHRQKLGEGLIGKAAQRRKTIVANDVSKVPGYLSFHLSETRAELVIPLVVHGRLVGVLDLQDTKTNVFSEEDVAILQSLARYIAHVIDGR
ncbi:MAG: GAF domain-containing protein, partial [Candidatus Aminicenantes bacterium]|nr:GAF domain-containing protein [Candidatus Aminicenantes bacterium]